MPQLGRTSSSRAVSFGSIQGRSRLVTDLKHPTGLYRRPAASRCPPCRSPEDDRVDMLVMLVERTQSLFGLCRWVGNVGVGSQSAEEEAERGCVDGLGGKVTAVNGGRCWGAHRAPITTPCRPHADPTRAGQAQSCMLRRVRTQIWPSRASLPSLSPHLCQPTIVSVSLALRRRNLFSPVLFSVKLPSVIPTLTFCPSFRGLYDLLAEHLLLLSTHP
ncbi:hypothetical protein M011DRAFT_26426 [Sporormia fimetaria CBS 119925]|uniref:Uncharacterized protein n=1 Tax=Sporormia fimetaria CBS 119925 TaxID=1340428 RepID=A0A6A6VE33_9PLEO|nr:hypothetical protein M011DRAFT_26426 [Sporormia fimetaria CBS 119925]